MKYLKIISCLFFIVLLSACVTSKPATINQSQGPICPDSSIVDLEKAVDLGIECVKADPGKFDQVFATFISIAKENPDFDNSQIILRFINAVAIDAPYVSEKTAKMKWNRYFSPYLFVSADYEKIYTKCDTKDEVIKTIIEELNHKKIGLYQCSMDSANERTVSEQYQHAEEIAVALIKGLKSTCLAYETK